MAKLVYRLKDLREEQTLRGPRVTVGRDPGNDIVIADPDRSISRFHARFELEGRQWRIIDTRSTNRVRVNGELIVPQEPGACVLADGDAILLGDFEIHFVREAGDTVVFEEGRPASASVSLTTAHRIEDLSNLIEAPPAAHLTKEAEVAIDRAKRALTVLATVGRGIAGVSSVDDIVDTIVDLVFEVTPAERAALFLWDEDSARLVPKRTRTRTSGEAATMTVSESLVQQAFADKSVVQMDPQVKLSPSMYDLRLRSAVAVPLLDGTRAVGVIYADTPHLTGAFEAFGVSLLSALAGHLAIFHEQTRLLRKARQEERWRLRLEPFLPPGVVGRLLTPGESTPGFLMTAEEVEITVLFSDMAGFTARTEDMEPRAVLLLLNRCFSHMTEVVQEQGGTVDKYIGDCLMAVFGAPVAQPDHSRRAVLAALGIRDVIGRINAEDPGIELDFRIGMHSGRAVAGDVGHVARRNWTVLGSTVNLASRMETSVAQPGQIVLTDATRAGLGDEFELRPIAIVKPPKGIRRGFTAFELIGFRSP